ncbi:neuroblast differentiation-associated protein AHNAK [Oryzias latipes]|uniref:neuroblast differentiation-associated protein AHNAK n=1 Tax=Oryzias latipes TaxID=8090 RepID=UPI000CE27FDA|nr:neuroblast differentiation-associated protein AHNAK [Oryzias latipes]
MCDCFHLAFPNWHAASSGAGRRLQGPEAATYDDSVSEESSQLVEEERPRPQGSSPVEEFPEAAKHIDAKTEAERDPHHKSGHKTKRTGLGSMFERRTTPKMSKLKEVHSPEGGVIVRTPKDGCAEGLVYSGGGKEGIFIKEVVPESPASKSLKVKEGDQILSATVYFDNVPYEDAIQILEHAQAYKVKLCLKRKPDITETEPGIESDVIPEEEISSAEMREQGKTKRRGDARISWPKFPSFGKGRKSRFTRSHSSSEADEQRKLELSPTTSDTESPIKSQDALKGKKKHKLKLSALKKRGRISSSEDTEAPTTAPISGDAQQAQESDMLSPESLEGLIAETVEGHKTEDLKMDKETEQNNQTDPLLPQTVELISLDSTLKTADPTVCPTDHKSPSEAKPTDGKTKKTDRLELKMKILGKDRLHKKDAKVVSSPKRLKTLGASLEKEHQPESEDSQKPTVEKHTAEGTKITEDPYERLSKGAGSTAELPKREDIKIPGMEDMSMSTAAGVKEPFRDDSEENHSEAVQLSFDVKSVKEAVSKLPGFKLPQVDTSGVLIPEEITVIDANAQRISVKTPTKVSEAKAKKEAQQATSDRKETSFPTGKTATTASADLTSEGLLGETTGDATEPQNKTKSQSKEDDTTHTFKREQITISWVETPQKISILHKHGTEKASSTTDVTSENDSVKESNQIADRTTIIRDGFRTGTPDTRTPDFRTTLTNQELTARTDICSTQTFEMSGIKVDSLVDGSTAKKDSSCQLFIEEVSVEDEDMGVDSVEKKAFLRDGKGGRFKLPHLDISLPKVKGSKSDVGASKKEVTITRAEVESDVITSGTDMHVKDQKTETTETEMGASETQTEPGGDESRFKMPKLGIKIPKMKGLDTEVMSSKKDAGVKVTSLRDEVQYPEADVSLEGIDMALSEQTLDTETPLEAEDDPKGRSKKPKFGIKLMKMKGPDIEFSLTKKSTQTAEEIAEAQIPAASETSSTETRTETKRAEVEPKPPETDGDLGVHAVKFKMPKLGIKMPKIKGPELDLGLQKMDADVTQPKAEVQLPKVSGTGVPTDVSMPDKKTETEEPKIKPQQSDSEPDRHSSKFKMPAFDISFPKLRGPEVDLSSLRQDKNVDLPEAGPGSADIPIMQDKEAPDATPHQNVAGSPPKFRTTLETPKPKLDPSVLSLDKEMTSVGADILGEVSATCSQGSSVKTTELEQEGKESKFRMPYLSFSMPKVKGPKSEIIQSKTRADVTVPQDKTDVTESEVGLQKGEASAPEADSDGETPELQVVETDGQHEKDKTKRFGLKMPKLELQLGPSKTASAVTGESKEGNVFHDPNLNVPKKDTESNLPDNETKVGVPEVSKTDVSLGKAELLIPEGRVKMEKVEVKVKTPQAHHELTGQGSRLKISKLGITLPKVKGTEMDVNISKDADMALGVAKTQNKMTDTELRGPSTNVGKKAPEAQSSHVEQTTSKFKVPSFKFPKIGVTPQHISTEMPDSDNADEVDRSVDVPGSDPDVPEVTGELHMKDDEVKEQLDGEAVLKHKKTMFSMPKFSFSKPSVKASEVLSSDGKVEVKESSLSQTNVDITLTEVEVKLHDANLKKIFAGVDTKTPEIEAEAKTTEESSSTYKMPTFKLPKFGSSDVTLDKPAEDIDIKTKAFDMKAPGEVLSVTIEAPSGDIKTTESEQDRKGGKFKMPKLGFSVPKGTGAQVDVSLTKPEVDVTLQGMKKEVQFPDSESKKSSVDISTKAPGIEIETRDTEGSPSKFQMPTFELPKSGHGSAAPIVPADVKLQGPDANIKEILSVTLEAPTTDTPTGDVKTIETEQAGKGGKFKMPSLGFSVPRGKEAQVDVSLTKPEVDFPLQETKDEVKVSDTELEKPSLDVKTLPAEIKLVEKETKGSPSKFKMPTFKLPKFGLGSAAVDLPAGHRDIEIEEPDIKVPEEVLSVTIEAPSTDTPSGDVKTTETEQDVKGGKFKMPSLGFSVPKVKGPEVDVSLEKPKVDLSLQEIKVEVQVSDTNLEKPSVDVKILSPEIKLVEKETKGSPSKFKMPTFKFPKFGLGSSAVDVPAVDKDVKLQEPDDNLEEILSVTIEAQSSDTPLGDVKNTERELDGKGGKFKMPGRGFSVPKADGAEVDVILTKPEVDVTLQEIKEEIRFPDCEASVDISTKAPGIQIKTKDTGGSPSKFKMPTFKLPKFGFGSAAGDVRADVKLQGPDDNKEEVLSVSLEAPSTAVPSGDVITTEYEQDGKEGTFRMQSLGFSVPKVKGPDVDVSRAKPEVDVTLQGIKKEVQFPDPEASVDVSTKALEIQIKTRDTEGSPSKFKMPTFKLTKFGLGSSAVDVPAIDKDIKIEEHEIKVPEEILSVTMEAPSTVGFSVPKGKETHVDVSRKKTEVDLSLQENKAGVKVSESELEKPSLDVKISSPEIKLVEKETKGSPSKFKMPTFKFPKFGLGSAAVDLPAGHRDIEIEEPDIKVPEEVLSVTIEAPSTDTPSGDVKTTETEQDVKGGKFKMPSLGFSVPKGKEAQVDVSLTKPEVDLSLQETKVEVQVSDTELEKPSVDVKISSPEIKLVEKETKGSPSKFKMPTFKFPKFGLGSSAVDVPAVDKDVKLQEPDDNLEEILSVTIEAQSSDTPLGDVKNTERELDGKGGKFKMPGLGFSVPKADGGEVDVSLTKPEVDVTLQEIKEEVHFPDSEASVDVSTKAPGIQIKTKDREGSPSKFKMPTFKLPKFGLGSAAVDPPAVHRDIEIEEPDIKVPEEVLSVTIEAPSTDTPSGDIKTTETEQGGKGGKFKMPSLGFSVPKVKGPEVDVNLEKPEVDLSLQETKDEVQVSDTELEKPSLDVKTLPAEIKLVEKETKGSPSKFKMPTFKLPKFGLGSSAVDVPAVDKDVKLQEPDDNLEEILSVTIEAPSSDTPLGDLKTTQSKQDGKFKMPSLGFSVPKGKETLVDESLTKPEVDVSLQGTRDFQLIDAKLETSMVQSDPKAPEINVSAKKSEGSPSKFKMPTFSLPKFGGAPPAIVKAPDLDKEVKFDLSGSNADVKPLDIETKDLSGSVSAPNAPETKGDVKEIKTSWTLPRFSFSKTSTKAPEADMDLQMDVSTLDSKTQKQGPETIISTSADEGPAADPDAKIKKTKFSLPKFSFSKHISKESEENVILPTGDVSLQEETVKIKQPGIKVRPSESQSEGQSTESKLQNPTFGLSMPKVEDVNISQKDVNIKIEVPDVDVKMMQPHAAVAPKALEIKAPAGYVEASPLQSQIPAGTWSKGGALQLQKEEANGNKKTMTVDVKGSKPKKDIGVMLPEFKAEVQLSHAEVKDPIDSLADEVDPKLKRPNWAFPKISFSRTADKVDANTNLETSNITTAESTEVCQSDAAVQGPRGPSSAEESSTTGPDINIKKSKFSLSKISFSKFSQKEPQVTTRPPHDNVFGPDVRPDVDGPQTAPQASELEGTDDVKRSTLKSEMSGIGQPKPEGPEINMNLAHKDTKEFEKVKDLFTGADAGISELEDKPRDARGSPLKFKMPALKLPKFGGASHDVTSDAGGSEKVTKSGITKLQEDESIPVKPPSTDATDDSKAAASDADTPKSGTDAPSHGSPSRFKLPSFKMPKLSLSRPKPEEEHGPADEKLKGNQLEVKTDDQDKSQTSKETLTSFGELFKTTDIEFDVSNKAEKRNSGEIPETEDTPSKPSEEKESETKSKQDTSQSPEKVGWFELPKVGLSQQSEPPRVSEGGVQKGEKSPPRETGEDETSPTSSLHSSDAFADVSSTVTSEHVGMSITSPTKVMVKYFDPTVPVGLEERTGDIFTSTTKTVLISDVPNLPEKITIPSSGVTSSSEDTLRLDSGKIHAITSNIQATPAAQHAKLLTAVQMQPAEDDPGKSDMAVLWAAEDPLSSSRTVFESRAVWETSGTSSQTSETVVITKQVTSVFDTTEPISGETASSIQRLRHTVHSEKMKFFDEGEK